MRSEPCPAVWEPPATFDDASALPSFPVESLPFPLRSWVLAEANATQTPTDLPAMLAFATIATATAQKFVVRIKNGWAEPLNIFVLVALPSASRKSPVFRDALRPIVEFEQREGAAVRTVVAKETAKRRTMERQLKTETEKAAAGDSAAAFETERLALALAAPPPVSPKLVVDDVTSEKLCAELAQQGGRLAVLSAEGGIFETMAGRYSDVPNIDVYLKAHAGDDLRVDRINRPSVHLKSPALTVGLAVQPEVVRGLADKPGFRGRGLLARFFYSLPRSLVGMRDIDPCPVPPHIANDYNFLISALLEERVRTDSNGEPVAHEVLLDGDARGALLRFGEHLEPRLGENGDLHAIADWAGKLTGSIARIAGLLHLAECAASGHISKSTMEAAIAVGNYLLAHAKRAFFDMHADPLTSGARQVLSWLARSRRTTFTKREAFEATKGRFPTVTALEPILGVLEARGYIRACQRAPSGPGRPSRIYDVNPHFASQYSQCSQNSAGPLA